jgi:hypothetical protein
VINGWWEASSWVVGEARHEIFHPLIMLFGLISSPLLKPFYIQDIASDKPELSNGRLVLTCYSVAPFPSLIRDFDGLGVLMQPWLRRHT